jgi:hypothetical protein
VVDVVGAGVVLLLLVLLLEVLATAVVVLDDDDGEAVVLELLVTASGDVALGYDPVSVSVMDMFAHC